MKVVPYAERYKQDFIDLNQGWIETLFEMEPEDYITLEHIGALVEQGIFFSQRGRYGTGLLHGGAKRK